MKHLSIIILLTLVMGVSHSCKKCNPCNDPKLVSVPATGIGSLHYYWEFVQAVQHSNGTATSSISMVSPGTTSINSVAADSVTTSIHLVGIDSLAGIKCLSFKGGYGVTCSNGGTGAIAIDGILSIKSQCLPLTTCCLISQNMKIENLGQYMQCGAGKQFVSGGVGITGTIENCKGEIDTVFLSVNFH